MQILFVNCLHIICILPTFTSPNNEEMNTQLLPQTAQAIEPTILRYYKNGRSFEIHRTLLITAMFGLESRTSFEDLSDETLREIANNFHSQAIDVTQEVSEESTITL